MMLTSSFLSMWLSNTATTAMMLPIANAILESLFGDLETLKQKCKSPEDHDRGVINGKVYICKVFVTVNQEGLHQLHLTLEIPINTY